MAKRASFTKSTAAPIDPKVFPSTIDATIFLSPYIPSEIKNIIPLLHQLPTNQIRTILTDVITYIKSDNNAINQLIEKNKEKNEEYSLLFSGLYSILRQAISSKILIATIRNDLLKINMPELCVDDICKAIGIARPSIEKLLIINRIKYPTITKLRWRIDVIISSGSLSKVMKPSIIVQLILSNGNIKTFEMSTEQFNQLRYSAAKVLYEMQAIDRHPIVKILNEMDKKDELLRYNNNNNTNSIEK